MRSAIFMDSTAIGWFVTFYYLCRIIVGASCYLVHWDIRESMTGAEVEIILQAAQLTHVRTSPHYPESNGKIERWHGTLKRDCIRVKNSINLEQARQLVAEFIEHYNTVRLHSAIGYVTPKDRLENNHAEIFKIRDQKLEAARENRKLKRQQQMVLTT